ncbi:MAG: Gfo/Idh/MocA family protein [Bernardetiaceae bacterium]
MLQSIIDRYKNYRKQSFLRMPERYAHAYAFVGAGGHSLDNLYPILDFLAVPLRYIVTRRLENAQRMASRYVGATGTTKLEEVLADPKIKGVFVCVHPKKHFAIAKTVLEAGKGLFIEKPPCFSVDELDQLQALSQEKSLPCVVGLQKRYAVIYAKLRPYLKNTIHYRFDYLTGAYPEGNPWWDLFIHPLDLVHDLFGTATLTSLEQAGSSFFVHVRHANGVLGSLTFSTGYSWQSPVEKLEVCTKLGCFEAKNLHTLTFVPAPKQVLGIPVEKLLSSPRKTEQHYHNSGFVPLRQFNPLYTHGYAGELETFLDLVEGRGGENRSSPAQIRDTFLMLERISPIKSVQ